ncbi:hypothetical protein OH77DRAFT_238464 [Trametes cingulata]|nr:hypothetical protein OH77DRAFT_238464 [Trametes cingulata]
MQVRSCGNKLGRSSRQLAEHARQGSHRARDRRLSQIPPIMDMVVAGGPGAVCHSRPRWMAECPLGPTGMGVCSGRSKIHMGLSAFETIIDVRIASQIPRNVQLGVAFAQPSEL